MFFRARTADVADLASVARKSFGCVYCAGLIEFKHELGTDFVLDRREKPVGRNYGDIDEAIVVRTVKFAVVAVYGTSPRQEFYRWALLKQGR